MTKEDFGMALHENELALAKDSRTIFKAEYEQSLQKILSLHQHCTRHTQ
ncbi:hypothetical protein [Enterococcus florum]|nr:hypothetical protein [Enterococcus florum]